MPTYKLRLRDGTGQIEDNEGIDLPDREHAVGYARQVARELMSCREAATRWWCLEVHENRGGWACIVPFTSVDRTLDRFDSKLRTTIELACERRLQLHEAFSAVQLTLEETRELVRRSREQN